MTIAKARQASKIQEKKKLIQDIKQKNPEISEAQLSKYNIDDLKKIQMAVGQEYYKDALEKEKGLRLGLNRQKMKYGGKMKKKYKYQEGGKTISDRDVGGKTTSDRDANIRLAWRLARAEAGSGGKSVSDKDFENALSRLSGRTQSDRDRKKQMVLERISKLETVGASPHIGEYQYGGMADMSAAPMIKQPQRKKRKASGFRTKYSKGGGVRSSKYKL